MSQQANRVREHLDAFIGAQSRNKNWSKTIHISPSQFRIMNSEIIANHKGNREPPTFTAYRGYPIKVVEI